MDYQNKTLEQTNKENILRLHCYILKVQVSAATKFREFQVGP